jgi:RluA family pseudouridine synthase
MTRLALVTGAALRGWRLDDIVADWLPAALGRPVSRSVVRRLIMAGAVRVDGRPIRRPGMPVRDHCRLDATIDPARLPGVPSASSSAPSPPALRVLYEDDSIIAVDKPPGLPTHATADSGRPHLIGLVEAHLGADYVGVHQRLDRDTSGVVLFAKSRAANPGLARAFAERHVEKTYHALTARPGSLPPPRWTARGRIAAAGKRRMSIVGSGGQEAETRFRVIESRPGGLLVEARPLSGRKHQIRVHLADAGLPILGDDVYGPPSRGIPRLMLHAVRLALPHPLTGAPLVVESPYPRDFADALEGLGTKRKTPLPTRSASKGRNPDTRSRGTRADRGTSRRSARSGPAKASAAGSARAAPSTKSRTPGGRDT